MACLKVLSIPLSHRPLLALWRVAIITSLNYLFFFLLDSCATCRLTWNWIFALLNIYHIHCKLINSLSVFDQQSFYQLFMLGDGVLTINFKSTFSFNYLLSINKVSTYDQEIYQFIERLCKVEISLNLLYSYIVDIVSLDME